MFVQNQEFDWRKGRHNQSRRLPLSAGKRTQLHMHFILQPKPKDGKLLLIIVLPRLIYATAQPKYAAFMVREGHIFQHRQIRAGAHRRVLINAPNGAVALIILHLCNILPANQHLSAFDGDAPADDIQHGGFAAAVAPNDCYKFPLVHPEVEFIKQTHFCHCAGIIDL